MVMEAPNIGLSSDGRKHGERIIDQGRRRIRQGRREANRREIVAKFSGVQIRVSEGETERHKHVQIARITRA